MALRCKPIGKTARITPASQGSDFESAFNHKPTHLQDAHYLRDALREAPLSVQPRGGIEPAHSPGPRFARLDCNSSSLGCSTRAARRFAVAVPRDRVRRRRRHPAEQGEPVHRDAVSAGSPSRPRSGLPRAERGESSSATRCRRRTRIANRAGRRPIRTVA